MTDTNNPYPITPPPELVQQWYDKAFQNPTGAWSQQVAKAAAQWGWEQREPEIQAAADQELEACCEWLQHPDLNVDTYKLRAARRPKPPTLNSIALQMLGTIERDAHYLPEITDTIRKALEQLND